MPNKKTENSGLVSRPPVVVILGHVDHGKTSILDKIRQTHVAEKEAGGITQHIGAYQAESKGRKITFLDTPGHEAFSAIRSRGAKVADVAVLVIAAEEGVKPQTKEAIAIIKQAEIPFVVAINKIDKENANPQKVRQELAENDVMVEDYGGTVPVVELSAKKNQGIDSLLEIILLLSEMEELAAPMQTPAKGLVIESHLDSRRGLVATLLVQEGELKIGDWVSAGPAVGKAKSLEDFTGKAIRVAIASQPCVMVGWELAPRVGDTFEVVTSSAEARKISAASTQLGPGILFSEESIEPGEPAKKIVNIIVKADVQSSLEAIDQVLKTIKSEEVGYRVINFGVGNISDADVKNARASNAAIVGFHVSIDPGIKQAAERENIKIATNDIIYELVEGVRLVMSELLEPEIRRIPLGKVKILALFKGGDSSPRSGGAGKTQIVGGKIVQGKAVRGALIDVLRNNLLIMSGRLSQLQQSNADITEAAEGFEVGIRFDVLKKSDYSIAVGDTLEIYQEEKIKRSI
jgi:translation initiation factor IF-2